jgi:hypothetical protein
MSWGQICLMYGLTWSSVLADVDSRAAANGLSALPPDEGQGLRSALNQGVSPTFTPEPYYPGLQVTPQPPSGVCP